MCLCSTHQRVSRRESLLSEKTSYFSIRRLSNRCPEFLDTTGSSGTSPEIAQNILQGKPGDRSDGGHTEEQEGLAASSAHLAMILATKTSSQVEKGRLENNTTTYHVCFLYIARYSRLGHADPGITCPGTVQARFYGKIQKKTQVMIRY
jgi:hypothetical protein